MVEIVARFCFIARISRRTDLAEWHLSGSGHRKDGTQLIEDKNNIGAKSNLAAAAEGH
jgi:hypothetical protein